jgi:uncharacterized phage protein (TIGR01671 family)
MRTIKFRGKRIDNGEWVYGAFYPIKNEDVYFIINNCKSIDFDDDDTTFNGYKVHKKSVGEFTGLHDKNGKEIYECEILYNNDREEHCIVKYSKEKAMFIVKYLESNDEFTLWESISNLYYSVGNIFENPELLTN